jgi:glycosyltransferase involved in cell wall biosynthesis
MTPIRVLALLEATTITGPAKNLFDFMGRADGEIQITLGLFRRPDQGESVVPYLEQRGFPYIVLHEQGRFDVKVLVQIRRALVDTKADIIQTHSVKSHFLVRLSGAHVLVPWIAFHHGYTATDLKMLAYNRFDRWSLRAPREIVTVSAPFAEELQRTARVPPDRITILHNAVDPDFMKSVPEAEVTALRESLGLALDQHVVLAIGRLSKEKAHADLIRAFSTFIKRQSDLRCILLIVGEGPERGALEELVRSEEITHAVRLCGHHKDVRPFFALATAFVLPSHSEGSPNVLLEAMGAEVPVVATSVGGIPEIVTDGETAILVPARDSAALADAIARVVCDESLRHRLREAALGVVRARYLPAQRRDKLISLYRRVVARR